MVKDRTYNKEYIRKVFTNKLIKFIEENGEGLYYKGIWDFFPKQYNKKYIKDYEYDEITEIFKNVTTLFSYCANINLTQCIDLDMKDIDYTNWVILIEEGYKENLKDIKKKIKKINNN